MGYLANYVSPFKQLVREIKEKELFFKRKQNMLLVLWRNSNNHTVDQQGICNEYLVYQNFLRQIGA